MTILAPLTITTKTLCLLPALMLLACAAPAEHRAAQLERLEIISRSVAFGGKAFAEVGQYERIVAVAHLRADSGHAANRIIVDLDKAPATRGSVRYQSDVVILRPRDAAKASRVLLVDLPKRGARLLIQMANEGSGELDSAAAAGNGYTMRRGHTLAWIGWQGDVPLAGNGAWSGMALPLASAHGAPITGAVLHEAVFENIKPTGTIALAYPAATPSRQHATLTVRAHARDTPLNMPPASWRYVDGDGDGAHIEVTRARGHDAGAIYQFRYMARDPKVMGLGLAALRDVTSYLNSGLPDAAGQANVLADMRPEVTLAVGVGQAGRVLRELIWQGFNTDLAGARVFDGAMPLSAGSGKSAVNARFAQPGRYSTAHQDRLAHGDQFPFSYAVTTDPVSGRTDGIFARCLRSATCPRLMHVDSSTEFWQARASLVVADGAGADIELPPTVRAYLMSSTQHMAARVPRVGICKHPSNPARQGPLVRALLDHLVAWTRTGTAPPQSRYPRHADAMLSAPDRDSAGFPDLGAIGVDYPLGINELTMPAHGYQVHVPMVDADGHDIAGVRLPGIAVPLATHAGWNVRRKGFAEGQLCDLNGLYLPFPAVPDANDPRRAIEQRYSSRLEYAKAVARAARQLRDQGLLLDEDVAAYIERARVEPRVKP